MLKLVSALALSCAFLSAQTQKPMELWYFHHSYVNSQAAVAPSEALIDQAAAAGYTGLALWDTGINVLQYSWWNPAPLQQVIQYALSKGLKVMPLVAPYGHSTDMLRQNWSWAEGERVNGTQFQVDSKGQTLQVINSFPGLTNGGFEQGKTTWFGFGDAGTTVDYSTSHSGAASGLITANPGNSRFSQTFTVQPWRQYHMRMFTKTQNFSGYSQVLVYGDNNYAYNRVNQQLSTPANSGWTQWDYTFNSGPHSTMSILMGAWGGTQGSLWFDDVTLEETALVYVIRGASLPLSVYDPNNPSHVFQENTDFGAISDPQFNTDPTFDNYWHQPMVVPVPAGSSLKPGQIVAMNWYAIQPEQGDAGASLTDPGAWQWMQQNAAAVGSVIPSAYGYFLGYDEMRNMNGTASAVAKNMTAAQLLDWHFNQVYQLFRQVNPAAPIYVWSDMFDPNHNAVNNYYLVEGDLTGSWTGLPADVIMMNWNLGALTASTQWFSGQNPQQPTAHRQVIAGYYDSGNGASAASTELSQVSGVPGIIGMMYTTFQNDYSQLATFANAARAGWPAYVASVPQSGAPTGATASFVKSDATTQGNWRNAYGADGYNVIQDLSSNPTYAAPTVSGQYTSTFLASTQDPRGLTKPSNPTDRILGEWFTTNAASYFTIDTNITDQAPHQVALYCVDYESSLRSQRIDVLDTNGNVLNTQTLSNFEAGVYMVWTVTGHVKFRVTSIGQYNGLVEGLFFGGAVPQSTASAAFVAADTSTKGNWRTAYGADGYNVIQDLSSNPTYAAPAVSGQYTFTFLASTQDPRGLTKPSNPADRILGEWFTTAVNNSFLIDTNITDQAPHKVALYCVDYESSLRSQRIDVLDSNGKVLNTQNLSNFQAGVYMVWTVTGHVKFRVTSTGQYNGLVEGLFFGAAVPQSTASAAFVAADTSTKGNWRTAYGADGYNVIQDLSSNPTYAAPAVSGQYTFTFLASTQDPRGLTKPSNPADRILGEWFTTAVNNSFLIDTNITDQAPHKVALYCVDYESSLRSQRIDVLDSNGNVLSSQNLSNFEAGVYMVWTVTGHVQFRITSTGQYNGLVEGLFFGGAVPQSTASAAFVAADTSTKGNWRTAYGADGYNVIQDLSSNPTYAAPAVSGQYTFTFLASTQDPRGLTKPSNPADRILGEWFTTAVNNSFLIDTNITDQAPHKVALYCVDYDSSLRSQRIDVLDSNGNVLNTQNLSNFQAGVYMVWTVTGHVQFRVTSTGQYNGLVEGLFFGGAVPQSGQTATYVKTDTTTKGNWRGVYGADGYNVVQDLSSNPTYAAPVVSGQYTFTFLASTQDPRGLQKPSNPADRILGEWFTTAVNNSFLIDTNITDQAVHQVALYCVDYESSLRSQRVDVLDVNGNVLNSQNLSNFEAGVYMVWNVSGHVKFRVTSTGQYNGLVEGLFFK